MITPIDAPTDEEIRRRFIELRNLSYLAGIQFASVMIRHAAETYKVRPEITAFTMYELSEAIHHDGDIIHTPKMKDFIASLRTLLEDELKTMTPEKP